MEVIGGASAVITVISAVTILSKNLNEIRDKYKFVALNITLVASQLSTIRAALEAIADWRRSVDTASQYSKQLDEDLALSLNCCHILVTVLNSKLLESGFRPGTKSKIKYLWLEGVLKEYLSNLEGQVRALQLLLTVFQCRTATEQSRRLERAESRTVIENLRAETASIQPDDRQNLRAGTASLQPDDREFQDTTSMRSIDVSVNFEVDSILLKHRTYKKVYSKYHVHRHHSASQSVNNKIPLAPVIDHNDRTTPGIDDETHGRQYQHRLERIESTTPAGDEEIDGFQIPKDGPQTSLKRVRAPLPVVDHSEASWSTSGNNEMTWTNPKVVKPVSQPLDHSTHHDRFDDRTISNSGLDLATIDNDPSRHHAGSSQSGLQTQNLSAESEESKSFQDSHLHSLFDSTNDIASLTVSARADSPTIRALDSPLSPMDSSLPSSASPRSENSTAMFNQSFPQPSFTLKPTNDVSQLSSVGDVVSERRRTQAELSRLQHEFAAAKTRGDEHSAQASLQQSINLIQETYLAREMSVESNPSLVHTKLIPRRKRIFSLSSLAPLRQMPIRARASQYIAAVEAVCSGNDTKLKELLELGIDVNARSGGFKTLFIHAAMYGHIDCLALLKQKGADQLAVDYRGLNALHSAVQAGETAAVEWLLKSYPLAEDKPLLLRPSKANKSLGRSGFPAHNSLREGSSREGFTPIHFAAKHGQLEVLNMLIGNGADIEAKCNRGRTPLHHAVISNHAPVIRALLSKGADLMAADALGLTPLHHAARLSEVDVMNILLSAGCKRSTFDSKGNMPIHIAAAKGHLAAVKVLRRDPADLEVKTASGESLLHIAVWMNQPRMVEYLLEDKVHVDPWSRSPPAKLDINGTVVFANTMRHGSSSTPLHSACFAGQYEISASLLDHGAWPNAATSDGKTPLMLAVESDTTDLVNLLLGRKAKVDAKIPRSFLTAQHIAAQMGNLEILQALFQHGASLDAHTSDFKYPADQVYLCKDPTKRAAVLNWFRNIRLEKAAQAREINALKRQRTVEQNQQHEKPTKPDTAYRDPPHFSPAYHGFEQENDSGPEAPPPPYVARLARRGSGI